jgi:hypothetical protein
MKELSNGQMEEVSGGNAAKAIGCTVASILLVSAFVGAFALTAGASAIAIAAVVTDLSLSPTAWGIACFT